MMGHVRQPLLTLNECAEVLGISMTMAYGLVQGGQLVGMQLPPKMMWRIKPEELDAYIDRLQAETQAALEQLTSAPVSAQQG
jgi:predicted DNA-binding transcriptional regulator AlpA